MGVQFPASTFARFPGASFLNNIDRFTALASVKYAAVDGALNQYIFRHGLGPGGSNQISLRKVSGSNVFRASTTVGGVIVTKDGTTVAVSGTRYHVAMTWQKNQASGIKLYVNAALEGTGSTTTQPGNYDSGDSTSPIYLAAKWDDSDLGSSTLEGFAIWPGVLLSANQILAILQVGWPQLVGLPMPAAFWMLFGENLARFPDLSGNGRHITAADIVGAVASAGTFGRWARPGRSATNPRTPVTAGAAQPGPFLNYGARVPHPTTSLVLSGLTVGKTYEIGATAFDSAIPPNESALSSTVLVIPGGVTAAGGVRHTVKRVLLRAP